MTTSTPVAAAGATPHSHGPGSLIPVQTRNERPSSFAIADFPKVTGREVDWMHSPIAKLQDLIGERVDGTRVDVDTAITGSASVSWVSMKDSLVGQSGKPEDRASAVAWESTQDALVIDVAADDVSEVTITRSAFDASPRAAHTVIRVAPFAKTTVVIVNEGEANLTENVEIIAGESSNVSVISLQQWSASAHHAASHFIRTEKDAEVTHTVVTLSGQIVRLNPQTQLVGQGSSVNMLGLYFADAGQHLEQQVYVHHVGAHTKSRVNYKGALQGAGARTVWIGDVLIGQDAVGTDSYEQNRNLILTDGTRADSIPNLEIKTGDIAGAGHASATGRFDDEQLFYLQARGISEEIARQLVVRGFLNEIVQQIQVPAIAERVERALDAELEAIV
jgi:Fe-S cluster assembly protein SufD